jgi:UDP-N-acetylmuramoylalanine--D-glutamate ligase
MERTTTSEMAQRLIALREHGLGELRAGAHNLREVLVTGGVHYFDDSGSTFMDATLLAIADLGKPLVWITDAAMVASWGANLPDFLKEHVDATVIYGAIEEERLKAVDATVGNIYSAGDLRTAVFAARELAVEGGNVLFSPACPAENGFANHAERAAEFKRAVKDL